MNRIPATVLAALVFSAREDIAAARDRADTLRTAARLAPFTTEEAEDHLFRRFGSHAMTAAEISLITERFADAARTVMLSGTDGIECMFSYDTLIDAFFYDNRNLRTDEYGGSFENRTRFAVELLHARRSGPTRFSVSRSASARRTLSASSSISRRSATSTTWASAMAIISTRS